jgi:hypothetical protein
VSEQMQRIHDKIAECDREAELRGWDTSGFPRLWFAALSRVAGLDLQERRRKARHPADGSIPLPVTRDTSPGICELQQQNDELKAEIARLRDERLTDEERKAIAFAADQSPESDFVTTSEGEWVRSVLTALLARNAPPEVVLPEPDCSWCCDYATVWRECLEAVRSSLAAAGVAVKEVGK